MLVPKACKYIGTITYVCKSEMGMGHVCAKPNQTKPPEEKPNQTKPEGKTKVTHGNTM